MNISCNLCTLQEGESAFVTEVHAGAGLYRRLLDIGLIPGTRVTCIGKSPAGDPCAYLIRGAVIALRNADAVGVALEGQSARRAAGAYALAV